MEGSFRDMSLIIHTRPTPGPACCSQPLQSGFAIAVMEGAWVDRRRIYRRERLRIFNFVFGGPSRYSVETRTRDTISLLLLGARYGSWKVLKGERTAEGTTDICPLILLSARSVSYASPAELLINVRPGRRWSLFPRSEWPLRQAIAALRKGTTRTQQPRHLTLEPVRLGTAGQSSRRRS
jgi:hypothetical protein